MTRVLVLGYGNPGRRDDGLGPAFARRVEDWAGDRDPGQPCIAVQVAYQLNIEDAALVAEHDHVVFVDATTQGPPVQFSELSPSAHTCEFTTHSVTPAGILGLARDVFGARPGAWALAVRGYEFGDFGERLSSQATENLDLAWQRFRDFLDGIQGERT